VFAADEFYLRAGQEFPSLETYEELWQLENGVGMVPLFRREAEEVLLEALPLEIGKVSLVTGTSFAPELADFSARLSTRVGVELQVVAVENRFFGSQVSVAGLLTGADILAALEQVDPGAAILLPDVLFNDADNLLLDDLQLEDLQRHFKIPILRTSSDPWGILDGLERLDSNEIEILQG
jgi:NifB/MoaA-like Fe-S oxidoreductase